MKRFKGEKAYLVFMFILSVFIILPGCSGGVFGGGHWDKPVTVSSTDPANGAAGVFVNTRISATFSGDMDPATLTTTTFTVMQGATVVPGMVTYTGVTAVFTPTAVLAPNTVYTGTITTGAKDHSANRLAADYVWSFTTGALADATAPTVTGTINANGATNVAINTRIGATFSEAMDPATITSTTFLLNETVTGTAVTGVVTYSGVSAAFTPAANLAPSTRYTVTIKGGVNGARDLAGNPLATDFVISWTTGAAADTIAPTVTDTINHNGATNVSINTAIGATFSEAMDHLTITNVTFTVKEAVSGVAVPGTVSYSGVSAQFIPFNTLINSTRYTVTIKGGVNGAKDLAGNPVANDYVLSWTTGAAPDITAPTVTGTIHANGATNVAVNTAVGATFSEGMNPLTITNLTFAVKEAVSGNAVAGTISYSGVNALFRPLNNLAFSTRYTVTVKGGVNGAKDLAGNPMTNDFVISWTTGAVPDTTPPTVTATTHANGATNVSINTADGAVFSEGMDPLTITNVIFTLKETVSGAAVAGSVSSSNVNALFIPFTTLTPSTQYTVTIKGGVNGAKDLAGNPMTSDYVWSWTTGALADVIAPTVTGTINANGATNIAVNTKAGATFSEVMDHLTITNVTFTLKEAVTGNPVAGLVSYTGVNAVYAPLSNLAPNTRYTATIKGGVNGAKDLAGVPMTNDYVWSWTTGAAIDSLRPTVVLVDPLDGATGVAITTTVLARFSKDMDPLTINTANFKVANVVGAVTYDAGTKYAKFTPLSYLLPNTIYTATVTTGVTDLAGNSLAVDKVWRFTTVGTVPPVVPPISGLGILGPFGIASAGGITNSGATKINGDVVLDPNDMCNLVLVGSGNDFGLCGGAAPTNNVGDKVITKTFPDATSADAVMVALLAKWNETSPWGRPGATVLGCGTIGSAGGGGALLGCSGNSTIPPGTYISATGSSIDISGDLTLDAQGNPNAVWVFQAPSSTVVTAVNSRIILVGGAKASNIWWHVGSSATLNGGTTFEGNILASASISMGTGATSCGRLLAGAEGFGAFTFLANTVSVPGHPNAPVGCQ